MYTGTKLRIKLSVSETFEIAKTTFNVVGATGKRISRKAAVMAINNHGKKRHKDDCLPA